MDGSRAAKLAFMEAVEWMPSEQPKKAEIAGNIWIRRSQTRHQLDFWKIANFTIDEMQEYVFKLCMCHDSMPYSVTVPYSFHSGGLVR